MKGRQKTWGARTIGSCSISTWVQCEVKWKSLSCVQLFATPWTILSMEFSRPEYWVGWLFPSSGDLPNAGIEPRSPTLQVDSLPTEPQGKLLGTMASSNCLYSFPEIPTTLKLNDYFHSHTDFYILLCMNAFRLFFFFLHYSKYT